MEILIQKQIDSSRMYVNVYMSKLNKVLWREKMKGNGILVEWLLEHEWSHYTKYVLFWREREKECHIKIDDNHSDMTVKTVFSNNNKIYTDSLIIGCGRSHSWNKNECA